MFDLLSLLAQSSLLGVMRGGVSFVFEHPFDVLKTRWQAEPHIISTRQLAKELYAQKGWRGFYVGFIPNTCRTMFKHAYRTPLWLFCTYVLMLISGSEQPVTLGILMALLEASIIQPLERLKVWMITSPYSKGVLKEFWHTHKFHTLYQGLSATLPRQIVAWVSFLWAQYAFRSLFLYYIPNLEWFHIVTIALLVGIVNTFCTLPFDAVKTHMQAYVRDFGKSMNWRQTVGSIYERHGIRGFYAGWKIRLTQYTIQALWTASMLDFFMHQIRVLAR